MFLFDRGQSNIAKLPMLAPGTHSSTYSGARCPVTDEDIFTNLSINNNCGEAELSGDTWPVSVSISGLTSQHDQHKYYSSQLI